MGEKHWGPGLAGEVENMAPCLIPLKVLLAKTMARSPRRCRVLGSRSQAPVTPWDPHLGWPTTVGGIPELNFLLLCERKGTGIHFWCVQS